MGAYVEEDVSIMVIIELYDGWKSDRGVAWRKGAMLRCQNGADTAKLQYVVRQKLEVARDRMDQDGLLKYWYAHQVGALMILLSHHQDSGFKSVPRLQPCLQQPRNCRYLFPVFLGPDKGEFCLEGYELKPASDKGIVQQFVPLPQSSKTEQPM